MYRSVYSQHVLSPDAPAAGADPDGGHFVHCYHWSHLRAVWHEPAQHARGQLHHLHPGALPFCISHVTRNGIVCPVLQIPFSEICLAPIGCTWSILCENPRIALGQSVKSPWLVGLSKRTQDPSEPCRASANDGLMFASTGCVGYMCFALVLSSRGQPEAM